MMDYQSIIDRKRARLRAERVGIVVDDSDIHPALYGFQRAIVRRALELGSCALFEDCGLGKTIQELEWSRHVHGKTDRPVLILAPLAVGHQMVREGERIGMDVRQVRRQPDVPSGSVPAVVANYEMLRHFEPDAFGGLALDESGILKAHLGKVRTAIVEFASRIPYRLAATATPAPNDLPELLNHAAYLGKMSVKEALALWYTQDGTAVKWRLKGHAERAFWQWVGTWAIAARKPEDIGHPMEGYDLPPLTMHDHELPAPFVESDDLFPSAVGIQAQRKNRRASIGARVEECAALVNADADPWVVWCDLNDESDALAKAIPDAVEVRGSDSIDSKITALTGFSDGAIRVLVTKPSIAGHGLNWQHCARQAFVGVGYSYEAQYQATRRCWRYGQVRPVEVHRFSTEADRLVIESVARKEEGAMSLFDRIPWQIHHAGKRNVTHIAPSHDKASGADWDLYQGDSVQTIDAIDDASVGLSIFSPPFPGMYVYTDSPHDMGNVASIAEMIGQFGHLMASEKMGRVLMPGRSVFIHITQGVAQLGRDGYVGMKDFRGDIIRMMEGHGWRYYGEVTIDKNPQVKAIRTKDQGLMFKSLANDASRMHPALSDMLLQFRKPGENSEPIRAGQSAKYGNMAGWVTPEDWILWARPVWYAADYQPAGCGMVDGIRETDVLNVSGARGDDDERHLCPLQLGVIERCVRVWSNPGDVVYSPFAGVGSEGVVALREGRRFVGGELKREYFDVARRNLRGATSQLNLFSGAA